MEFEKQLVELNSIISKIMYDYETHRGMPIDSIEKYQPDIKKCLSQSIEEERKRILGNIVIDDDVIPDQVYVMNRKSYERIKKQSEIKKGEEVS